MADLFLVKASGSTFEVLPDSREDFQRIGMGEIVKASVTRPRRLDHHRKFFALLKVAFENQEFYATMEQFRTALLVGLGWCETFIHANGDVMYIPKSLSFSNMDQSEFERVYDDALNHIISVMVPNADPRTLTAEANKVLSFA